MNYYKSITVIYIPIYRFAVQLAWNEISLCNQPEVNCDYFPTEHKSISALVRCHMMARYP